MILRTYFFQYYFITLIILAGCRNDIEGVYVANYYEGDTVKIYPDNKYVRIYYDQSYKLNSKVYADTGYWEYKSGSIYFHDWIDRDERVERLVGHGKIIMGMDLKKSFLSDEIKLMIDYDMNYYYLKQKKKEK